MEGDPDIQRNMTFSTVEDVKVFIKYINEKHYTNFVVETNNKFSLVFYCKHGVHRNSKSKGQRTTLHYNYMGCPAKIRFYKVQRTEEERKLRLSSFDLNHNHSTTKEVFESENVHFSKDEVELITTLKAANAKPSQIKRVLLEKTKKKVTIKRLKNLIQKISPPENDENARETLEKFLESTELEGGEIEWRNDKNDEMQALFITSQKMKAAFRAANPTLIQLDTSFEFEKARYKVAAFCYLDTNSDKTEIAAFAMMSEESSTCFEFVLNHFSRISVRQDVIFIIDKDFTEMSSIRKVFPTAIVLLCVFHCLKYMRNLFATIPEVVQVKEEVMDQFKKIVYSHTENIFEEQSLKFEELVENLEVRTGQNYVSLKAYYLRKWKDCRLMWVKCFRKGLPLLGDNTTNRIENKFGKLKESIKDTFVSLPDTSAAIIHLVNYADRSLEERYIYRTNKSLKIFSSNPKIRKLNEEASLFLNDKGCKLFNTALNSLEEKREKMEIIDGALEETYSDGSKVKYDASDISCSCSAFKNFQAPCIHILFIRERASTTDENMDIFKVENFHERYHRRKNLLEVFNRDDEDLMDREEAINQIAENEGTPSEPEVLNDKQKFKMIMSRLMTIGNLISLHPTKKFNEYLSEFEKVENLVRRGAPIFDDFNEIPELDANVEGEDDDMNDLNEGSAEDQTTEYIREDASKENLDDPLPQKSRFSSLIMKEKVKTKGRPKSKTKLSTFNKTAADKKSKSSKKIKESRKRAKRDDFIEDSTEEDEEEPVLDDDSDDSLYDGENNEGSTNLDSTIDEEVFFNNNLNL